MSLTKTQISLFQKEIYDYYHNFGRPFPWRNVTDPYLIFISEVMLQQTQTKRVQPKYEAFIKRFPTWHALARASFHDVLAAWQGLGYNRRARFLQQSAQIIVAKHHGKLPSDQKILISLPGIGTATAASVAAFAYNTATIFVETNIRVVFIHHFLADKTEISDKTILKLVEQTLDKNNPRIWYYALMDYGVMLKAKGINPIQKSKHYQKQSTFVGSDRQIRGAILRLLIAAPLCETDICATLNKTLQAAPERTQKILNALCREHFLTKNKRLYTINAK